MASERQRWNREELLTALETGWGQLLPVLGQWSEQERRHYAQNEGFPRMQEFLGHVCDWWETGLQRVAIIQSGVAEPLDYDIDAFNAASIERYRDWTEEAVRRRYSELLADTKALIRNLPEVDLNNDDIYEWLYNGAVEHYEEHQVPGGPQIR